MAANIYHATESEVDEVRSVMRATFQSKDYEPDAMAPFYVVYDVCDPDYRPEQYIFRRWRGKVVSALKVFVRGLHHPAGPVPVTVIGAVCTREELRGRGLIEPVIRESLEYSRSIGARAELIVTPRKDYYLRHGFRYFPSTGYSGPLPRVDAGAARIAPLSYDDAGWMAEVFNRYHWTYGPIMRNEKYVRKWILELRLARLENIGLKLVRHAKPAAYVIAGLKGDAVNLYEAVSEKADGADETRLLSFFRLLGGRRFTYFAPEAPLIEFLRKRRLALKGTSEERFMYYSLDDSFAIPGEDFYYSILDFV